MEDISKDSAGYLEQVYSFFADTTDVFELPHSLENFSGFVALTKRLSKMDNRANLFGIYIYDGMKGAWTIRYFGASSSRSFMERLRLLAFTKADPNGSLLSTELQKERLHSTLSLSTVAGIKMTRVTPEDMRLDFLNKAINHFGTDKEWNV